MSKVTIVEVQSWSQDQIVREINQREQRIGFLAAAVTWKRQCKDCNEPVAWTKTASGKPMLINMDGVSHFATCPGAEQRRRR